MPIYSLNLGFTSRSEGKSAVGFGAYISGAHALDLRTGLTYAYANKSEVIASGIIAPEGAPAWAKNPETLWNKVEAFEDRMAEQRFKGHPRDEEKNQKSLEARQRFKNSAQTAQTVMGALPLEFTREQAEACVVEYLAQHFGTRNLVIHWAIHWESHNPHFHAQITRRPLIDGEFSCVKDRDVVSKEGVLKARKTWEIVANKHLALAGHEVRIDSRAHADRGSLFIPGVHEGWYAQRQAEQGAYTRVVADNAAIREQNIKILCDNPEALIHEVASKHLTFTREHLHQEIIRRVGGDAHLFSILKARVEGVEIDQSRILSSSPTQMVYEGFASELETVARQFTDTLLKDEASVHTVGLTMKHQKLYTSQQLKAQEERLTSYADHLNAQSSKAVDSSLVDQAIFDREASLGNPLSTEQKEAIAHLCSGGDIRLVNGNAGTGKTTLLQAVAASYQQAGYRVLGTSFQGKAVEIMAQEIGIECRTVDSFRVAWENRDQYKQVLQSNSLWSAAHQTALRRLESLQKFELTDRDVIIVDEANMMGARLWDSLLKEVVQKGAKVLIVQDMAQLKSRDPGDFSRLFAEKYGYASTTQVVRQKISWQRDCSTALNDHRLRDGLTPYYEKGHMTWGQSHAQTLRALAHDYVETRGAHPKESLMALAYRNNDVTAINQLIHQGLLKKGELGACIRLNEQDYAIGDRIRFLTNDNRGEHVETMREWSHIFERFAQDSLKTFKSLRQEEKAPIQGVKNGTLGTIVKFNAETSVLTVRLDSSDSKSAGRLVSVNTKLYKDFTYGYAMTASKSEGATFDRNLVMADPLMGPNAWLVAMTRHKSDVRVYVNREQLSDFKDLVDKASYAQNKHNLYDYQVSNAEKPYFERVVHYKNLSHEAMTLREEMEASHPADRPLYKHGSFKSYQDLYAAKKEAALAILQEWSQHRPFVALAGVRRDVLEAEAGLRPRLLSDLEIRASHQAQEYMDLSRAARDLWNEITLTHPPSFAQEHPRYEAYCAQREDRNSLAAAMMENVKLYSPFFRVTEEGGKLVDYWGEEAQVGKRVYWMGVESHAKLHAQGEVEKVYLESLSAPEQETYNQAKTYVTYRNQAACIYAHLKENPESTSDFLTSSRLTELQRTRDALAFALVVEGHNVQAHLEKLGCKEAEFFKHAILGETRTTLESYQKADSPLARLEYACKIMQQVPHSKAYWLLKDHAISPHQVKLEAALFASVTKGEMRLPEDLDAFYKPFRLYKESAQAIGRLWSEAQEKAKGIAAPLPAGEKAIKMESKESLQIPLSAQVHKALKDLNQTRDYSAAQLVDLTSAAPRLLKEMGLDSQKLNQQAQRFSLREEVKAYVKKYSIEERVGAANALLGRIEKQKAYWLLREHNLNPHHLKFDAGFARHLQDQRFAALTPKEREDSYTLVRSYMQIGEQLADLRRAHGKEDLRLLFERSDYQRLSDKQNEGAARVVASSSAYTLYETIEPYANKGYIHAQAAQHEAKEMITGFKNSPSIEEKALIASLLLNHAQREQAQGESIYIAAIKRSGESFEKLHLYDSLLSHQGSSLEYVKDLTKTIEEFTEAKESYSAFWREIVAQTDLTALKEERMKCVETMREAVEGDFRAKGASAPASYVLEKWLLTLERQHGFVQRETQKARQTISGAPEELEEGLKNINIRHVGQTENLVEKALKKEKLALDAETLTKGLLELERIKESEFAATKETVKVLNKGADLSSLKNARNEAAARLLKDAVLKQYVENHASSYVRRIGEFAREGKGLEEQRVFKEQRHKDIQDMIEQNRQAKIEEIAPILYLSQPLEGTPAERYLRSVRGIKTTEIPMALRYLPAKTTFMYGEKQRYVKHRALLVAAHDKIGHMSAVQITYLGPQGNKAVNAQGEKFPKVTFGARNGSFVEIQAGNEKDPIYLAEGVETALSVKEAGVMGTIYACLGLSNMENLDVKDRQIVILADWDGSPDHTWKNTLDAQKVLQERGNEVSLALPVHDPLETPQKVDFNDVLLKHGPDEVRLLVSKAAQTIAFEKPVDEDLAPGKLSHEERSLKYIQIQLNALKITYDDDKREKLMEELDRDIDRMEKMGHLDKASYLDSSVRKSIETYRETRENQQSRGCSI